MRAGDGYVGDSAKTQKHCTQWVKGDRECGGEMARWGIK